VNPRKPLDCASHGGSGEREDVLQDGGEVLIEPVGESLFTNPSTPLVLSDLGVAGENLVQRRQGGIAVRGDHVDGGCELVAVDIVRSAEEGDVGVVTPASVDRPALNCRDDLFGPGCDLCMDMRLSSSGGSRAWRSLPDLMGRLPDKGTGI
jgi:hypothetical protein